MQNALFRSCAARFGQIAFLTIKVVTIVTLAWNLLQQGKTARFPQKLYKTLFSDHAQHVLAKSHFWESKFSQSSYWPQILSKNGKQCAFHENCTKRSFQVMRSTFWPNRILERQVLKIVTLAWISRQNGKTARFSWKLYKTLFSDHAEHVLGKSHFWAAKFLQSSHWPQILSKNGKTARFPWKLYKTLFWDNAQHVLAKSHFWASKLSKSSHWPQVLSKKEKQCAFYENCTKGSFQVMRSTFWPNRIFERQSYENRETGLKFSSKRENGALSMKIVQNALFRSCAVRFGQIKLLSLKVLKIVTLASNSLQNGKTVGFLWKLYKQNAILGQHVLAKSHFRASKFSNSSHWPEFLAQTVKQCAFQANCTKRSFQVMGSTFWPNCIFERQSSNNRHTRLKFASKRENSALSMKIVQNAFFRLCGARFGQIASLGVIVVKFVTLAWNSRQNGKTVRFP